MDASANSNGGGDAGARSAPDTRAAVAAATTLAPAARRNPRRSTEYSAVFFGMLPPGKNADHSPPEPAHKLLLDPRTRSGPYLGACGGMKENQC